jgi:large subunit ribosomal protein L4
MKTKVMTLDAKSAGEIDLSDEIFGLEPRADLLQRVVVWQLAKRRAGTHKTLRRGEVNRTTKKWYKQKGTGSARHGARSAPQFVGGGKAMAPVLRSHAFDLPKKVRALGLRHALSAKAKDSKLIVLDEAKSGEIKTKLLVQALSNLGIGNALIVDGAFDENFALSARNIPAVALLVAEGLNVYDILRRDTLVLTKAAVKAIEERLA